VYKAGYPHVFMLRLVLPDLYSTSIFIVVCSKEYV